MKKYLIQFIVIPLFLGFLSCENFLDSENYTKKNTSNYPQTASDAAEVITGIYSTFYQAMVGSNVQDTYFYMSELASDDRFGGGGENDKAMQSTDHLMNYGSDRYLSFWKARYSGIFRANSAIQTIGNCMGYKNDDEKNQLMGEAYFLRAFFYHELVEMFGSVPLVIETTPQNLPRTSVDSIYGQIASDLEKAIQIMPSKPYTSVISGHATKWAAEALMARVFLFYTGFYNKSSLPIISGGEITKDKVIAWLEDCINNSGHQLVSDYRNLWTYTNEYTAKDYKYDKENNLKWVGDGSPETIFAIKFSIEASWSTSTGFANGNVLHFGLRSNNGGEGTFPFGQGWGAGPVNSTLWKDWAEAEPNDIRRKGSILYAPDECSDYKWGQDRQMEETGYWQKKYMPIRAYDSSNKLVNSYASLMYGGDDNYQLSHPNDLIVIRLADVMLMHAELTGNAKYLNIVRERAGLSDVSYSLDALKKERRWELCFEGRRWADIRRWGDAPSVLAAQEGILIRNNNKETFMKAFGGGYKARYEITKGFMPIPESEIALSNGVMTQNPGWDISSQFEGW